MLRTARLLRVLRGRFGVVAEAFLRVVVPSSVTACARPRSALSATSACGSRPASASVQTAASGLGQAVGVLVGQRLGQSRAPIAARTVWTGFTLAAGYAVIVASVYLFLPRVLLSCFRGAHSEPLLNQLVPILLCFSAFNTVFDGASLIFSSALRAAGDTRFAVLVARGLAWPCMVLPTWLAVWQGWPGLLYWAWGFASFYICSQGAIFLWRFCGSKWQSIRLIAAQPATTPSKS